MAIILGLLPILVDLMMMIIFLGRKVEIALVLVGAKIVIFISICDFAQTNMVLHEAFGHKFVAYVTMG